MALEMKELIRTRKSVRTFDGRPLGAADRKALETCVASMENPFSVPVDFRLLNAKEYGLSSPVIVGAEEYLAAKVRRQPNFEIAFGYSFELVCLFAWSLGIGTVMLAASLNRSAFEKALAVREDEIMPVASPLGYPAAKKSIRETVMRKGIKADTRKPFAQLFFRDDFTRELSPSDAGVFADALEAVRWAPSAANGQPWRAVVRGESVHFYEAKSMKDSRLGDVQKVDLGIALAHFDAVRREDGIEGGFVFADPGIKTPENTFYIVSFRRNQRE